MPANRRSSLLIMTLHLLVIVSLACSLPSLSRQTGSVPDTTTSVELSSHSPIGTPSSLPPALVATYPPPGSEVPLAGPITLQFNQPMDQRSVEASLSGQPTLSGSFHWDSESALSFIPDAPFLPGTNIAITVGDNARSQTGLGILNPITLTYRTVGYLHLSQALPERDSVDVNPTSAVVAVFNRPVVALGQAQSEPAFTLEPETIGRGEWINTSTYIFYPEPAFRGGETFTVTLNRDLTGLDGSPLDPSTENENSWSFSTSNPVLLSIDASDEFDAGNFGVRLDADIVLTFNQPVDLKSVEKNFQMAGQDGRPVSGELTANEDQTVLTFKPENLLDRNVSYSVTVGARAADLGGTPLGVDSSIRIYTVPGLRIDYSNPPSDSFKDTYSPIILHFTAHLADKDLLEYIIFSPQVPDMYANIDSDKRTVYLGGRFDPERSYSLSISPDLPDAWGNAMGYHYVLNFRTLPLEPQLSITTGMDVLFLRPEDTGLPIQVTNVEQASFTLGSVPLEDMMAMLGPGGYDIRQTYLPRETKQFQQVFSTARNLNQSMNLDLSPAGARLTPGVYYLRFNNQPRFFHGFSPILLVSNLQVTLKTSSESVFVWAVDLRNFDPVVLQTVKVYDESGRLVTTGETNSEGIFQASIPTQADPYTSYYAIIGNPGEDLFGAALSSWNQELFDWSLGIPISYEGARLKTYIYSDRPIYQPGQTVYFRAAARQAVNGRYSLPDIATLPLTIYTEMGEPIEGFNLPLSAFGTVHGEFVIPEDAQPGDYRIAYADDYVDALYFQVASYRKPEIDLRVRFESPQFQSDQTVSAMIQADYYFGAPASNVPIRWSFYAVPAFQDLLPGYSVGALDTNWLYGYRFIDFGGLGTLIIEGSGITGADGSLRIETPNFETFEYLLDNTLTLTLEVTAVDESGLPVSSRESAVVHPGPYYAGVKPDRWTGRSGMETGYDVLAVDWEGSPAADLNLEANFTKVSWVRQDTDQEGRYMPYSYQPVYTHVGSAGFITGEDGMARLAFTPPDPGTYQLEILAGEGIPGKVLTQTLIWVEGPGVPLWPPLTSQRVKLVPDKDQYLPGESAQVFIPNPLEGDALALITFERSYIMRQMVVSISPGGETISIPLENEDAPNVYISAILLGQEEGGVPGFRHGIANLTVQPDIFSFDVDIQVDPVSQLGPGDWVSFRLRVTDDSGGPVQGEFSLALVDKAVLATAAHDSADIHAAFYGQQPLGTRTALSLAAYSLRLLSVNGVGGGGGGDDMQLFHLRENFEDTAHWRADILTDANGEAAVNLRLPDNLTTWVVDVRGITQDSRVGQAQAEITTAKDLLIRPVAPRFLVAGDRLAMAAIVHNNTLEDLSVETGLRASGFALDDQTSQVQLVNVTAGGRTRVEWWGVVEHSDMVDVIFSASSGDLQDASRPSTARLQIPNGERTDSGGLPVLHYSARQTFATAGMLEERGERLELVSLPREVSGGQAFAGSLTLELTSSLGAAALSSLDALERFPYENNESIISRLVPNLETYRSLQVFGIEAPELTHRLERELRDSLVRLLANQNPDGSWAWWSTQNLDRKGDPDITAYILFGLSRANQLGMVVDSSAIRRAVNYLTAGLPAPEMLVDDYQFDRLAFQHYALAQAGAGKPEGLADLYDYRSRLSPSSQALLAVSMEGFANEDGEFADHIRTILSDLKSTAVRSSTGVYWESSPVGTHGINTPVSNSAIVIYALSRKDPASPVLPDAVRYLMAHRSSNGGWSSTYETSWALIGLVEYMKGAGELGGAFSFSASLNGVQIASGQAREGGGLVNPVNTVIPASSLYPDHPNAVVIQRESGVGRLYYTAHLNVSIPVDSVPASNQGIILSRDYFSASDFHSQTENTRPANTGKVGDVLVGKLTLILPHDAYYLMVADFIPAGAELLDMSLETSARGEGIYQTYDSRHPLSEGWGWWYFHPPTIYNDRIVWASDYLPSGTYVLIYTINLLQTGDFQVLPASAWQTYFPEVQGHSQGTMFRIQPDQ